MNCSKCKSDKVIENVEVRDYDSSSYRPLSVTVPLKKPTGGIFSKSSITVPLKAVVCSNCGYTEFYLADTKELEKE